jgi:hypothetical protein
MAALEVLALNTTVPRIEAPQTGDTYTFPRAADVPLGTALLPAVAFTGDLNTGLFSPTADTFAVATGGTERLRVTSAGNLGLGVTPSAWVSTSKALQLGVVGGSWTSISQQSSGAANVMNNAFETAANSFAYLTSNPAVRYNLNLNDTTHSWHVAPSGTAGTAITFTQAMTLDASGNLGLGTTSPAGRLHVAQTNAGGAQFITLQTTNTTQANGMIRWQGSAGVNQAFIGSYVSTADTGNLEFGNSTTSNLTLSSNGNLGLGTSTFGTSAAKVLAIANGTEPSTGPADTVQFFSVDRSAGNTIPGIYCEGTGVTDAAITNVTVTNKIAIKVNGTVYYLLATTSAA